ISCEGYRRSCRVATARVRTRRHTTLLWERGSFTDGICEAPLSLESQAVSLPGGQDYKPAQQHFVSIFSTAPQDRFYWRRACPVLTLPWLFIWRRISKCGRRGAGLPASRMALQSFVLPLAAGRVV